MPVGASPSLTAQSGTVIVMSLPPLKRNGECEEQAVSMHGGGYGRWQGGVLQISQDTRNGEGEEELVSMR